VKGPAGGVKLLGNGEVTRKLNVKVDRASKAAVGKVVAAGGPWRSDPVLEGFQNITRVPSSSGGFSSRGSC